MDRRSSRNMDTCAGQVYRIHTGADKGYGKMARDARKIVRGYFMQAVYVGGFF